MAKGGVLAVLHRIEDDGHALGAAPLPLRVAVAWTDIADDSEMVLKLVLKLEIVVPGVVLPAICASGEVVRAELRIPGVGTAIDEFEIILSLINLILCQEPELSLYLYCCAGFAFHILTLLTYIVYGCGGGNGVIPPAHSMVPGFP